jgi:hypothetical protein
MQHTTHYERSTRHTTIFNTLCSVMRFLPSLLSVVSKNPLHGRVLATLDRSPQADRVDQPPSTTTINVVLRYN